MPAANEGEPRRSVAEVERAKELSAPSTTSYDFVFSRGKGSRVWDVDGKSYIDGCSADDDSFIDGCSMPGVFNIGYHHPKFDEAMKSAEYGPGATEFPNAAWNDVMAELRNLLPTEHRWRFSAANDGTGANEAAIKSLMDRRPTRHTLANLMGAFHGRTGYSLNLNFSKPVHTSGYPFSFRVITFPFPEAGSEWDAYPERYIRRIEDELVAHVDFNDIIALFWEPVQGEGGIKVTSKSCFQMLYDLLKSFDILLVADEVQCGGCRTGKFFGFEHYGVVPDVVAMAKWLGNGAKTGAAAIRDEYAWKEEGRHSGTWPGDPYTSAAARATLRIMQEENLAQRAEEMGLYLRQRLSAELASRIGMRDSRWTMALMNSIAGLGLMQRIRFRSLDDDRPMTEFRNLVVEKARHIGAIIMPAGNDAIRIMPPLVISKGEIDELVHIIVEAIFLAMLEMKY